MFTKAIADVIWIKDELAKHGVMLSDVERVGAKIWVEVMYRTPKEVLADLMDLFKNTQV